MANNVIVSAKYSLNKHDLLKGLVIAVFTPILPILQQWIAKGFEGINWVLVGSVAAGAALTYLTKNFFTDSAVIIKQPNS